MSLLKREFLFNRLLVIISVLAGLWSCAAQAAQTQEEIVIPRPVSDDNAGFKQIFDGKTLKDWDGDPIYWRVENGAIVGEATEKNKLESNTFIIWRGGQPADFELKLDYRVSSLGNSGVQYRSQEVPGSKWVLGGYQADIDGPGWAKMFRERLAEFTAADIRLTAENFDERGRAFLAFPGQLTSIGNGTTKRLIASLGDGESLERAVSDDWNQLHLIARGNLLIHILNGRVTSMVIDDDDANRRLDGVLGFQLHAGPPMKVEFRNVRLKTYSPEN